MSMKDPRLAPGQTADDLNKDEDVNKTVRGAGRGKRPAANNAYKFRISPYDDQAILIAKTFGCCRFFWNIRLADREWAWHEYGIYINPVPRDYRLDERYEFLGEVDQQALQNVRMDQEQAYKNFFKNPEHYGFPQPKKRKGLTGSYTTNAHYYETKEGEGSDIALDFEAQMVLLPKLGWIPAILHRKLPDGAIIKNATVSRDSAGRFFVSVGFFDPELASLLEESGKNPQTRQLITCTGLDYSSTNLFINEMGLSPGQIKQYAKHERMLARRQRQLSRKVKGSNNYYKKLRQVNKLHRKIANARADFLHKVALAYARNYDVVCVETLNMKAIGNKHFHLGKATFDNAWGMFLRILAYKLERRGGKLVKVDKWFASSKQCCCCGYKNDDLKLDDREWTCPECRQKHHRDRNAAWNILVEGIRMLVDGEEKWDGLPNISGVSSYAEAVRENKKRTKKNTKRKEKGKEPLELLPVPARTYSCLPDEASCFISAGGTPVTEGITGAKVPNIPEGMLVGIPKLRL